MEEPTPQTAPATVEPTLFQTTSLETNNDNSRKRVGFILLILIILCIIGVGYWWFRSSTNITTDNAFVEAHIHTVAARISGQVTFVHVRENELVHAGDLLFELTPADYQVKIENAEAEVDMARNETSGEYAKVGSARGILDLAKAHLHQAETDLQRGKNLYQKEVIPREKLDRLETDREMAAAQVRIAEENLNKEEAVSGKSVLTGSEARIRQKQAKLKEAALNLAYTKVYAPADGYVTRKSVEPGNYIQPGQPVMTIVRLQDSWVTANYKESQLAGVTPGQRVEFSVDAYPAKKFTGKVESIMAGTGAAFSLLPPENATGNYVKVVQRIPVRIAIDHKSDPDHLLRTGMSVVPTIFTDRTLADLLKFNNSK